MKNIAVFLYNYTLLGGVQKVTYNLVKEFYDHGLPIKCIITCFDSGEMFYQYPKKIKIYKIGNNTASIKGILEEENIGNLILQVEQPTLCNKIAKITREHCNNILVLHNSPKYWLRKYYTIKQYIRNPIHILQLIKMLIYWKPIHKKIFKQWVNDYGMFCVSKSAAEELKEIVNGNFRKIDYIYNFHEDVLYNPKILKSNIITFAGRLCQEKRPLLMLKVWERLNEIYPDWRLIILGDGPLLKEMKKYIHAHNLKNVELKGKTKDVEKFLRKSKITLLFSKYEGLPTVLLEAIYNNNSILACQSDGGTKDIVMDEVNGFICKASSGILTERLQEMMNNNGKLAITMGQNDIQIIKRFSNSNILNKWKKTLV